MKNRYPLIITLVLLATFFSCQKQEPNECLIAIPDKSRYSSSLSNLLDEYRFIPLSTGDDHLAGRISKVVRSGDRFYLACDRRRILVFRADGSFSHRIDRQGRGPQEYAELADFDIADDRIYLLGFRNIHIYTLEGDFIRSIKLPFNALNLQTMGRELLIRSNKESLFYRVDIASGETQSLLVDMKQSTRLSSDNCFRPHAGGYLMQEGFSNTFYRIAHDFTVREIDLLADESLFDEKAENDFIRTYGDDYDTQLSNRYIGESAGWSGQMLCQIQHNPTYEVEEYVVADLASHRGYRLSPACRDDVTYMGAAEFFKYAPRGSSPEGFITFLRPAELREAIRRHGDDGTPHYRHMKEQLLDRLQDDDNPVLVEFRFKQITE